MGNGSNKKSNSRSNSDLQLFSNSQSADIGDAVVFSTEKPKPPPLPTLCSGCRRLPTDCVCKSNRKALVSGKLHARIERKGRGGKTVTILERFAPNRALLDELCTALKKRLGAGGMAVIEGGYGRVEVQGERTAEALEFARSWIGS